MKLRNKKTGKIVDHISFEKGGAQICMYVFDTYKHYYYNSLAELNADWEDVAEEPKEHWAIDLFGEPIDVSALSRLQLEKLHRFGNDFITENATMKAIEKIKAWKRLKDKGFRFLYWNDDYTIDFMINGQNTKRFKLDELSRDLCTVFNTFGGEE